MTRIRKWLSGFLLIGIFLLGKGFSQTYCESEDECCLYGIYNLKAILSHTEGRGIGYHRGYTTLEFLGVLSIFKDTYVYPFIDIRGHGLNDRKLAANIGMGIRYLSSCNWIFGINGYYDVRQGSHKGFDRIGYPFQQIGFGFEALGPYFDVRLNFYQPIERKNWRFSQVFFSDSGGLVASIHPKYQTTLKGVDAEIGTSIGNGNSFLSCLTWETYLAGGPYYLKPEHKSHREHDHDKGRWGGKLRFRTEIATYYFLETRMSYDPIYNGTLQVCVGVNFPLFPQTQDCPCRCQSNCSSFCSIEKKRISQPVQRVEIMPLISHKRRASSSEAVSTE